MRVKNTPGSTPCVGDGAALVLPACIVDRWVIRNEEVSIAMLHRKVITDVQRVLLGQFSIGKRQRRDTQTTRFSYAIYVR